MHSIPYTIYDAKSELVQPEASRGQKRCHFTVFEGKMGHGAFSASAHGRGKAAVHRTFTFPACSVRCSTEMLWSRVSWVSFCASRWHKHRKIQEESSSPATLPENRLKSVSNSLNIIWRKKKHFEGIEQLCTRVQSSTRGLGACS